METTSVDTGSGQIVPCTCPHLSISQIWEILCSGFQFPHYASLLELHCIPASPSTQFADQDYHCHHHSASTCHNCLRSKGTTFLRIPRCSIRQFWTLNRNVFYKQTVSWHSCLSLLVSEPCWTWRKCAEFRAGKGRVHSWEMKLQGQCLSCIEFWQL